MGSAKNTSTGSRKERIEELRRAERARERRNRFLVIAASTVVVAGLVAGGVAIARSQSDDGEKDTASDSKQASGHFVTGADGVKSWKGTLTRNHVTKTVAYAMEPPVGGDHNPVWMNCNGDVYTKAVNNMNAVHSLEHGAVWVTYNSKAPEADVKALAAKVRKTPYTLMSPVEDQKDPKRTVAWSRRIGITVGVEQEWRVTAAGSPAISGPRRRL